MPTKITFSTAPTGNIVYIYNAVGQKVEKQVFTTSQGSVPSIIYYLNGFQYVFRENYADYLTKLQFFPTAEGYVKNTVVSGVNNYSYVYNYTDHLGNVRLSYQDINKDGLVANSEILEESNYYPFGMKHSGYNSGNLQPNYKYKYQGQERQDELGLNMYDYGARNYDPALGRWMNIDPLAEKFPSWSPYNFCMNNPMRLVDPDGRAPQDWINFTGKNGQQQVVYDSSVKTKAQAEAAGYTGVKQVFETGTGSSAKTGEVVNFQKDGKFSVNGGNTMDTADGGYTTQGGSYIGRNSNTLEQLAPVLSNTGDAAVVVGTIMCLTGVGAPIGAGLITYGGYASTTGTVMDLTNDANNGTLTTEKVITKGAMLGIPEVGGAAFKALGEPAAGKVINAATIGADRVLDEFRDAKVGPYREN